MRKISVITSSSNQLIKDIRLLYKKKNRWERKEFFIEGTRSVEQCLKSDGRIKHVVYSSELLNEEGLNLIETLEDSKYKVFDTSAKVFKSISDTESPQGILAVVEIKESDFGDMLSENNFLILLDRVQDPGNLGTIIRTADAFGANGIIVTSGCVDVYNPKTVRSTMGSIFQIPVVHIDDISEAIGLLKGEHISIIASSLDTDTYSYDMDFKKDCALVIGNEGAGISTEVIEQSDQLVKIKMTGKAESLNAGIASGVLMYEVLRQRTYNL